MANEPEWVRDPDKVIAKLNAPESPYAGGCGCLIGLVLVACIFAGILGGFLYLVR